MKKLFLASEIDVVAKHIAKQIPNVGKLKTAFITTGVEPSGDTPSWFIGNRQGLVDAGFNLFDYTITDKTADDIQKNLGDADIIHVNGGNTLWTLLQAQKSGFDAFIKDHVKQGKIYMGSSAGSIIASPDVSISRRSGNKIDEELEDFTGFNLVDFFTFPHWGREDFKDTFHQEWLVNAYTSEQRIMLLNDHQYVHVEGETYRIVDVRED